MSSPAEKAKALFTGSFSPSADHRARLVKSMMAKVLGPEGPGLKAEPEALARRDRFPRLHMAAGYRKHAQEIAEGVAVAFVSRDFSKIARHAGRSLRVLWPNGALERHETGALLKALEKRKGATVTASPRRIRAYAMNELMGLLPGGVGEAIAAFFEAPHGILVTMSLDDRRGTSLRFAIMTSPDERDVWYAHNLPLPNVDEAIRASTPRKADEDESLEIADRVARHFLLGHGRHVRSLRNRMMDRVLVDGAVHEAEALPKLAEERFDDAGALEIVFLGTKKCELTPAIEQRVKTEAKKAWKSPLEKIRHCAAVTTFAPLDAEKGEPKEAKREIVSLLIGIEERGKLRWRLGGLFRS